MAIVILPEKAGLVWYDLKGQLEGNRRIRRRCPKQHSGEVFHWRYRPTGARMSAHCTWLRLELLVIVVSPRRVCPKFRRLLYK